MWGLVFFFCFFFVFFRVWAHFSFRMEPVEPANLIDSIRNWPVWFRFQNVTSWNAQSDWFCTKLAGSVTEPVQGPGPSEIRVKPAKPVCSGSGSVRFLNTRSNHFHYGVMPREVTRSTPTKSCRVTSRYCIWRLILHYMLKASKEGRNLWNGASKVPVS